MGNLKTGLWKKIFGMGSIDQIKAAIDSVMNDQD